MLYETLNQPFLLLSFFLLGALGGVIFDVGNFVKFLCLNKKFACIFFDIIETCCCLYLIFIFNLKLNYGVLRLFPAIIFMTSFSLERLTIGKIVAKFYICCYNLLEKLKKRKPNTNETNKNG